MNKIVQNGKLADVYFAHSTALLLNHHVTAIDNWLFLFTSVTLFSEVHHYHRVDLGSALKFHQAIYSHYDY